MTPQMGAILGYVLERTYTTPELVELTVTPDGHLIGRSGVEGALGKTVHMGSASDLRANLRRLDIPAGLGQGAFLHRQIGFDVLVSRHGTFVPQPKCDDANVDASLQ